MKENSNNPFFRRTVGSIGGTDELRSRSDSCSTMIEDEPQFSPNVREARAAPILRGGTFVPASLPRSSSARPSAIPSRAESTVDTLSPTPAQKISVSYPATTERTPGSQPPPYSPPVKPVPRYKAILPPDLQPQPQSPGPVSPGMQNVMANRGAIPMSDMERRQRLAPTYNITNNFIHNGTLLPVQITRPLVCQILAWEQISKPGERGSKERRKRRVLD